MKEIEIELNGGESRILSETIDYDGGTTFSNSRLVINSYELD